MAERSVTRGISPPRASSSRTRWPLAVPPTAGLHDICPMASRFMVRSSARTPIRAAARAASHPACPAPMTSTSCMVIGIVAGLIVTRTWPTITGARRPRSEALVEFGFSLPGRGPLAQPAQVLNIALTAEKLRYTSVFVTDHIVLPASTARSIYPYSPGGQFPGGSRQDYLEPF